MSKRKTLNEKRLTRRQVQALIEAEGVFHTEFTASFAEVLSSSPPQIYELAEDRFLFVHDPNGMVIPGRGDIYSRDYLLRMMRWMQRVQDDYAHGRGSSVEHWSAYSRWKGSNSHYEKSTGVGREFQLQPIHHEGEQVVPTLKQ